MSRIPGVAPDDSPEFRRLEALCIETLGFMPNSVLAMLRVPGLAQALGALNGSLMGVGQVDKGFKRLIAHMASRAAGCQYCMAHTAAGSQMHGVSPDKLDALWSFETSPLFSPAERVALELALAAGQQPNAVDDALFERVRAHWSEEQILEITGVVSLFGFLNRWNDTLATPLESHPVEVAQRHLAPHGWSAGKHLS
ncbi:peroxidase [Hydrogenophaga crassostreae]|uniref:Peroxidase n=1 Tax=Hydrogenophaga crassostreae TaxID=1763535 RepID=A0A162VYR0_9BURK|nr:carboxymuconolactone decarboxylase family protein [Hydrogenophaga crassostreae]AOW11627.1 peroxidase [Hydrogenophaga crassostreae]OAD41352.1 peroxidase [Hydrogenophaga crassostreae]